ncbi:MAG: indolepyruvate oxidoreductase subunit beta [Dehalococcoidales bacterium]
MKMLNLLITGVGGQGIILASNILGEVACLSGYDIKKTDTLGMAQRGGSVISHVRVGLRVHSPLISRGDVDLMLALEKMEGARWSHYLKRGSVAIINDYILPPPSVSLGDEEYPSDDAISAMVLRSQGYVYFIDAARRAAEMGNDRVFNVFLLGCTSVYTPFRLEIWRDAIMRLVPAKVSQLNWLAFREGRKELRALRKRRSPVG